MKDLKHLALADDGTVVAQFAESNDANKWCIENNYCYLPFNPNNKENKPTPAVGDLYKA